MKKDNLLLISAFCLLCQAAAAAAAGKSFPPGRAPGSGVTRTAAATPAAVNTSGGYIEASVADNGAFTIGTLTGDTAKATDNDQPLLYGHPSPSTGDTMIYVDGAASSIHSGSSSGAVADGDSTSVTLRIGSIDVLQRLTVKTSQATGNKDTIEIYFKVTNIGGAPHTVGLRTQLDTLLGTNDGAPFRVPGVGEVTKDLEFDNDPLTAGAAAIPQQALVLDSLTSPGIISLFTFTGLGFGTPDRVVFGYWPASVNAWDYTIDPARSFLDHNNDGSISGYSPDSDSSVIVWWGYPAGNAFVLAPGASREMAISYGIGNCTSKNVSPFFLLFCSPSKLLGQASGASYAYSPVNVTAFVTNTSAAAVPGAAATLSFPADLELAAGYSRSLLLETAVGSGALDSGKTAQLDWQVTGKGRRIENRPLSLALDGAGGHSTVMRDVEVMSIPGLLYGQATDDAGLPLAGAAVTALSAGAAAGAAVTQADGTYAIAGLADGQYTVRVAAAGRPDSYSQAVVASGAGGASGNPTAFAAALDLKTYAYPNPARSGRVHIAYYTAAAAACEISVFNAAGELVRELRDDAPGAGWHTVDWNVDNAANGVYLYRVKAGSTAASGKFAVLKRSAR